MKLLTRYSVNTLLIILLMCPAASAATNQCVEFGTDAPVDCVDTSGGAVEGTAVLSTGEGGGTKFLREDGDGTSSWQSVPGSGGDLLADGTVPLTANWDIGNFDITLKNLTGDGAINIPEISNTAGDLKIQPDVQGDVVLFGDTDVGDAVDGKRLYIHRKAAEGDEQLRMYVDAQGNGQFFTTSNFVFNVNNGDSQVYFYTSLLMFNPFGNGETIIQEYATISAAGARKYIQWQLNDTTDYYELTREDANILGFDIQMPLITDAITASGAITATSYGGITEANLVDKSATEVITGDWDFGGGGIEIENNTAIPGACTVGQLFLDTDGTSGQQLYGCEGGSFVKQGDGGGAAGANTALSNLAAVQINTTLFSDTADTDSLGTTGAEWLNLYLGDAGKFYMGLGQDVSLNRSSANTLTIVATTLIDMSSTTGALTLPTGVIGSRPSPSYGMVRADSGLGHIEWYDGSAWKSILDGDDDVADSGVCSLTVAASDADSANADYTCNGTNDEVQINAAIDALPATGGTVCLTDGTFVLEPSTQIGATDDYWAIKLDVDNTSLLGAGMSTVLQLEDTWTAGASDVGYLVYSTGLSNLKIQNIAFDGNLGNNGTGGGSGIWLDQTLESTISGNYIHDFDQEGIRGTTLSESLITDNVIENIGGENNVGYAIHIDVDSASPDDSVRTVISNNRIWGDNTGGSPWGAQDGIIVGSTSSGGFGITVEGNSVYGYLDGIMMHAPKSNIIGNNVQSQTWRGIVIGTNANYVNVTGNVVQDQNWTGIDVFGDYVLVSGNTIFDIGEANAYSSIFIESGADEALVVGNVIVDTAGSGYAINVSNSSCDNTVLSWNKYSGTGATSINDAGTNTQIFDDTQVLFTFETINNLTITKPAVGSTLTIANSKTLTVTDDATVSGTNTGDVAPSGSNNQVLTDDGAGGITSEANLMFDGSILSVDTMKSSTGSTLNFQTDSSRMVFSPRNIDTLVLDSIASTINGRLHVSPLGSTLSRVEYGTGTTADPCGTFAAGTMFYNSTSNYFCFCDGSNNDLKMTDNSTACF